MLIVFYGFKVWGILGDDVIDVVHDVIDAVYDVINGLHDVINVNSIKKLSEYLLFVVGHFY
jgi:hypothetical protein